MAAHEESEAEIGKRRSPRSIDFGVMRCTDSEVTARSDTHSAPQMPLALQHNDAAPSWDALMDDEDAWQRWTHAEVNQEPTSSSLHSEAPAVPRWDAHNDNDDDDDEPSALGPGLLERLEQLMEQNSQAMEQLQACYAIRRVPQ